MPRLFSALGPYKISELRRIAEDAADTLGVLPPLVGRPSPTLLQQAITRPVVLLWLEKPDFGHFICLGPRGGGVELYDPLGQLDGALWRSYLDDTTGLNGGGLRSYLQRLDRAGALISYNGRGPQGPTEQSCGLWALLRAFCPEIAPSEFRAAAERLGRR